MKAVVRIVLVLLILFLGVVAAVGVPIIRHMNALNDQLEELTEEARVGKMNDHELAVRFMEAASQHGFNAENADITVGHPEPGTVEMKATFKVHPIPNSGMEMTVSVHSKRP